MITANWFFIIFTLFPSFFIGWSIKFFIYQSFGIFLRRQPEKEKNSWHLQNQTTWLIFSYLFSKEEHNLIMYKLHVQGCERIVSKSSLHLGQRNRRITMYDPTCEKGSQITDIETVSRATQINRDEFKTYL